MQTKLHCIFLRAVSYKIHIFFLNIQFILKNMIINNGIHFILNNCI